MIHADEKLKIICVRRDCLDEIAGDLLRVLEMDEEVVTFELCDNGEFYMVYSQFDFFELGDDPLLQDELLDNFMAKVWSIVESYGFKVRRPALNRLGCHGWKGYRGFKTTIAGILGTFDYVPSDTLELLADEIYDAYKEIIKPHLGGE